jgi:hypothetical protein
MLWAAGLGKGLGRQSWLPPGLISVQITVGHRSTSGGCAFTLDDENRANCCCENPSPHWVLHPPRERREWDGARRKWRWLHWAPAVSPVSPFIGVRTHLSVSTSPPSGLVVAPWADLGVATHWKAPQAAANDGGPLVSMAMVVLSTARPKVVLGQPRCLACPKLDPGAATTDKEHRRTAVARRSTSQSAPLPARQGNQWR